MIPTQQNASNCIYRKDHNFFFPLKVLKTIVVLLKWFKEMYNPLMSNSIWWEGQEEALTPIRNACKSMTVRIDHKRYEIKLLNLRMCCNFIMIKALIFLFSVRFGQFVDILSRSGFCGCRHCSPGALNWRAAWRVTDASDESLAWFH